MGCWLLQVFMFIVNDKGTSWAYATPDFKSSLGQPVLNQLRSLADVPESAKLFTEVCRDRIKGAVTAWTCMRTLLQLIFLAG